MAQHFLLYLEAAWQGDAPENLLNVRVVVDESRSAVAVAVAIPVAVSETPLRPIAEPWEEMDTAAVAVGMASAEILPTPSPTARIAVVNYPVAEVSENVGSLMAAA